MLAAEKLRADAFREALLHVLSKWASRNPDEYNEQCKRDLAFGGAHELLEHPPSNAEWAALALGGKEQK